jgi:hypothetical protein
MGVVSRVNDCDRFVHWKRVVLGRWWKPDKRNWEDGGSLTQEPVEPSKDILAGLGKGLRREATLTRAQVWWFVPFSMWVQLYPLRRVFQKPKVLRDGMGCSFYTHCSAGDKTGLWDTLRYWSLDYVTHYYTSFLLLNFMCFYANIQMHINFLCIHQIFMLELSPASTQCTHGVVVKLFCR